jgi:hypothetical protein
MKLKIHEGALRLRLDGDDVALLVRERRIERIVRFGPGAEARFVYSLEIAGEAGASAVFSDGRLRVRIASDDAERLTAEDGEGIRSRQDTGAGQPLEIVVEKDLLG